MNVSRLRSRWCRFGGGVLGASDADLDGDSDVDGQDFITFRLCHEKRIFVVVGLVWLMGLAALEARAQFGVPITAPAALNSNAGSDSGGDGGG